jgi:hypothetical protein
MVRMQVVLSSVVLTSLVILVGCGGGSAPVRYGAEQNPAADFATARRYAFASHTERPPTGFERAYVGTEIMTRRIERRVRASLEAKGFSEVNREEADFIVFYGLGVRDQVDPGAAEEGWSSSMVNVHGRAALIVDFVAAEGEHLWHGYAEGVVTDEGFDYETVISQVVDDIMNRFEPPPAAPTSGGEIEGAEEGADDGAEEGTEEGAEGAEEGAEEATDEGAEEGSEP